MCRQLAALNSSVSRCIYDCASASSRDLVRWSLACRLLHVLLDDCVRHHPMQCRSAAVLRRGLIHFLLAASAHLAGGRLRSRVHPNILQATIRICTSVRQLPPPRTLLPQCFRHPPPPPPQPSLALFVLLVAPKLPQTLQRPPWLLLRNRCAAVSSSSALHSSLRRASHSRVRCSSLAAGFPKGPRLLRISAWLAKHNRNAAQALTTRQWMIQPKCLR